MDNAEIRNAIIDRAEVSIEDHGLLTAFVHLDYGSGHQGFGGYQLYAPHLQPQPNYAGLFLFRVLEVVGVQSWHQLPGHAVRVKVRDGLARAIGHIVKDQWFEPGVELRELEEQANGR